MDGNCVYAGMLVDFNGQDCLVVERKHKMCSLLCISTRTRIDDVCYDDLNTITGEVSQYNKWVRSNMSNRGHRNLLFVKNAGVDWDFKDGSRVWFTSDTHFCHDNILNFCDRPFENVEIMNERLIEEWNNRIDLEDHVFHLGDFCWGGSNKWIPILQRLNGHIHLIVGNHDVKNLRSQYLDYFESVSFQQQITVEGRKIYLNHYPFLTYGGIYRKDKIWQLFGHVHSKDNYTGSDAERLNHLLPTQYDVGVDNNNYCPINFHEVRDIIDKQTLQS